MLLLGEGIIDNVHYRNGRENCFSLSIEITRNKENKIIKYGKNYYENIIKNSYFYLFSPYPIICGGRYERIIYVGTEELGKKKYMVLQAVYVNELFRVFCERGDKVFMYIKKKNEPITTYSIEKGNKYKRKEKNKILLTSQLAALSSLHKREHIKYKELETHKLLKDMLVLEPQTYKEILADSGRLLLCIPIGLLSKQNVYILDKIRIGEIDIAMPHVFIDVGMVKEKGEETIYYPFVLNKDMREKIRNVEGNKIEICSILTPYRISK